MSKTIDFPFGNKDVRLAMLGMVEGNGHPYSWRDMGYMHLKVSI